MCVNLSLSSSLVQTPWPPGTECVAKYNFQGTTQQDLPFSKGDVLSIIGVTKVGIGTGKILSRRRGNYRDYSKCASRCRLSFSHKSLSCNCSCSDYRLLSHCKFCSSIASASVPAFCACLMFFCMGASSEVQLYCLMGLSYIFVQALFCGFFLVYCFSTHETFPFYLF